MPPIDPGLSRAHRALGAAIGASGTLAACYGAHWSGHVESLGWITASALTLGALLGGITWGLFVTDSPRPQWWFSSLFGAAVGMLAGGLAAFPVGALFGAGGGAVGGPVALAGWLLLASPRAHFDVPLRALFAAILALMGGVGTALWMAS